MALTVMNVEEDLVEGLFSVVSAVLLIGQFQFIDVEGESVRLTDADRETATNIAALLKVCADVAVN